MDKIEVTQVDREAAADVLHDNLGWYRAAPVRAGEMDNDSVVQAFARHRLATRTDATPVAWMPIESAPKNKYILLQFDGPFDDKESPGVAVGKVFERGVWLTAIWASSTSHKPPHAWAPIPANHIEEPRAMVPATDVAALVEAAKETNAALERDGDPAFAHLILANKAALAPFTKGQNDE